MKTFIIAASLICYTLAGCTKSTPVPTVTISAYIKVTNNTSNPYLIKKNGATVGTLPANMYYVDTTAAGVSYEYTATQESGFILSATVYTFDVKPGNFQTLLLTFP